MAISNLQGLSTQSPYTVETVDKVKDLLNSGQVDVGEVSQYFNVPKSLVIQSLTGIAPDAYTQDTKNLTGLSVDNVNAVERLIQTGVASTGDIAEYFNAPAPVIERHLADVRGYNQTAITTAQAGMAVQDENRFASYQSAFGNDNIMNVSDPAYATAISGEVQRQQMSPEQLQAEAANILNRAQSPSEIAKGMQNLTTFAANPSEEVLAAISAVSGVPASAGLTQYRAWADFEFRPRMRPYFNAQGQTAGGPQLVTGRSAEATIAENAARNTTTTGGGATGLGGGFDLTGGGVTGVGAGGGVTGGGNANGVTGTGVYGDTGLGTNYATGSEIPTGLRGSEMALKGGASGAIEMLDQLNLAGRADLADQYALGLQQAEAGAETASGFMQPYQQAGETALQQQMALSGALGQEAFDQAYQESPQMAFLREQGMRANLAGSAATGGLGGGNVQKELQRFGQGLASQGLQQQISNLSGLTSGGQNAAGTMANISTGLGTQQLTTNVGLGNQLANYNLSTGLPAAQQIGNLGVNLATGRTQAGQELANQYGAAANAMGNVYSAQGRDAASMMDSQRTMLMNMVQSGAINEAQAQEAYGTAMANLQAGTGGQLAGVPNSAIFSPNYGQQAGNAFEAASAGAWLGGQFNNNQQPQGNSAGFNQFFGNPANYYQQGGASTTAGMPISAWG